MTSLQPNYLAKAGLWLLSHKGLGFQGMNLRVRGHKHSVCNNGIIEGDNAVTRRAGIGGEKWRGGMWVIILNIMVRTGVSDIWTKTSKGEMFCYWPRTSCAHFIPAHSEPLGICILTSLLYIGKFGNLCLHPGASSPCKRLLLKRSGNICPNLGVTLGVQEWSWNPGSWWRIPLQLDNWLILSK